MPTDTADRPPVKSDETRKVTFYLTETQRRELLMRMSSVGERSITHFLVEALSLDTPTHK